MQKLLPLILLLVAALVAALYFLAPESDPETTIATTSGTSAEVAPADALSAGDSTPEAVQLENDSSVARTNLDEEVASPLATPVDAEYGYVTARLVDSAGNPLGGNELFARARALFGEGEELTRGTSASDGTVRLEVPAGDGVTLVAQGAFWAPNTFDLAALRPGEEVSIGDVVLTPADRVHGRVLDPTGRPVIGAKVDLRESGSTIMMGSSLVRTAVTDDDGRYHLQAIPAGTYRLRALAPGFAPAQEDPVVLSAVGKNVDLDLHLGQGRSVTGVVLDGDSRPVDAALVGPQRSLFDTSFAPTPENPTGFVDGVQTDQQGRFVLSGLEAGIERLVIRRDGFATQRIAMPAEGQELVVKMRRSLSLSGQVVDHLGKPVADAEVRLDREPDATEPWEMGAREAGRTRTGADGRYRFPGLNPGNYTLDAYALAGQLLDVAVPVETDIENHQVQLEAARHLVIKVEDPFGQFVAGAEIEIHDASVDAHFGGMEIEVDHGSSSSEDEERSSTRVRRGGGGYQATTDKVGHAVLYGVPEGEYVAKVTAAGYAEGKLTFDRLSGHQQEVVVLPKAAQLVVQVVSPERTAQPGVEIYLKRLDEEGELITEKSDGTGRVVWPRLESGRYEVGYREAEAQMTGMIVMGLGGPVDKKTHPVQEVDLIAQAALEIQIEVRDLALVEVLVKRNGQPVGGVEAWVEKPQRGPGPGGADFNRPGSTKTDARGLAILPAKEPGKYELVVRAGRQAPQVRQEVTLVAGSQDFEVEIPGGEVVGNLFADGRALAGANLTLETASSGEEGAPRTRGLAIMVVDNGDGPNVEMASGNPNDASAVSDSDGDFRFTDVPAGQWVVQCRARGFERWSSDPFTMHEDGTVNLGTQRLVKGASLRGQDLGFDAEAASNSGMFSANSLLQLQDESGEVLDVTMIGGDGSYQFKDLKAGTYQVQRGAYTSEPIEVGAGEDKTHDLPKE